MGGGTFKGTRLFREVAAGLARGATVLTGNQRAARTLRRAVEGERRVNGLASWTPPAILAWDVWVAGLWHRLLLDGAASQMLLNRTQEHALWRSLLEADPGVSRLGSLDVLAQMASDAWKVLAQYHGISRLKGSVANPDTEAFARWAAAFEERCRRDGYLPRARLEAALRGAAREGTLSLAQGSELLLIGFDRLRPAQQALLDALGHAGVPVHQVQPNPTPGSRTLIAEPDENAELQAAATWARGFLTERPHATVAVIVPRLGEIRPKIERVFRHVLAPEAHAVTASSQALPFEFSLGTRLAETPIGGTASGLLRWAVSGTLDLNLVSDLLLSPYFAGGAERTARAEFDAFELRTARLLRPEIRLDWLSIQVARSPRAARLTGLHGALRAMQSVVRKRFAAREERLYGDWAESMRDLLGAAAWACGSDLHSIEYQTREKWDSALDELATLDFEGLRVPPERALECLDNIARETTFAPESRDAPLQILGPEEAAGSEFDAVWFLGASDLRWPAPISGNPLLAWTLRRELHLPGSDPGADAAQARRVAARIAASAPVNVFSYAIETQDGRQRPSPALAGLHLVHAPSVPAPDAGPPVALEVIDDRARIAPLPNRPVKGGAAILKAQAACGFRAFAEHRLYARKVEGSELGMDARERGDAVHTVLERFWTEVKSQANLKLLSRAARDKLLLDGIEDALRENEAETAWDAAYLDVQRKRLLTLLSQWLNLEAGRATAFTVLQQEMDTRDAAIGPLRLSLRADRMDQTAGGLVLIDYKSGDLKPAAWLGDRPDEPQLPLYAALMDGSSLQAVAFGKVRPGKSMALEGLEESPGTLSCLPREKTTRLREQREEWYDVLARLAFDFAEGNAEVAPKQYPATCQYCAQRLICRLDVRALDVLDDDEEEDDLLMSLGDVRA